MGDGSTQNVDPFWLYQSDTSNAQYALCIATGACTPPDMQDNPDIGNLNFSGLPVGGVTFDQAQTYCAWMGGSLPTAAQFHAVLGSGDLPPGPCADGTSCSRSLNLIPEFVGNPETDGENPAPSTPLPAATLIGQATAIGQDTPVGGPTPIGQATAIGQDTPVGGPTPPGQATAVGKDTPPPGSLPTPVPGGQWAIILQSGGNQFQESGIILQNEIILQNNVGQQNEIILQNDIILQNGIILQQKNGVNQPPGPPIIPTLLMHVYPLGAGTHANGLGFRCVIKNPILIAPMCTITRSAGKDYPPAVCPAPGVAINVIGQFCSSGKSFFTVDISNANEYSVALVTNQGTPDATQTWMTQNCTVDKGNSTKSKTRLICTGDPDTKLTVYAVQYCDAPAGATSGNVCLNGYEYDPSTNMCNYKATSPGASACPTGFTLSPQFCCAAAKDYPAVCPPGSVADSNQGCMSYSSFTHTIHQDASLPECGGSSGGNGPAGCTLVCDPGMYPNSTCTACTGKP